MTRANPFLGLLATLLFMGCGHGSNTSPIPEASPLHGGLLVPLPENQGYVELLNDKREKRGRVILTDVVVYLLLPDQKSPSLQKPSVVSVSLDTPKGKKTIPLLPKPEQGNPFGSARFVSDFGPYELNQIGGDVSVVIDGKTLTGTFRGPR